jgi:very-short-patch-repair endonuclease
VVSRRQLVAAGLSGDVVDYAVMRGRLMVVHRGVYLVGGALLTTPAREAAAVLACGAGAALSHRSATYRLLLFPYPASYAEIEVSTTLRGPAGRPGIRVHHVGSLAAGETHVIDGLRTTTVRRTLLDLAGVCTGRELERALATALRTRRATPAGLLAYIDRHPRCHGVGRLRRLLTSDSEPAFTRSDAEELLLDVIRSSDLPAPELNQPVGRFEVDILWRDAQLIVEADSWRWHGDRDAFERDRARDAELTAQGFRVVRVTWRQLTDEPQTLVARLAAILAGA